MSPTVQPTTNICLSPEPPGETGQGRMRPTASPGQDPRGPSGAADGISEALSICFSSEKRNLGLGTHWAVVLNRAPSGPGRKEWAAARVLLGCLPGPRASWSFPGALGDWQRRGGPEKRGEPGRLWAEAGRHGLLGQAWPGTAVCSCYTCLPGSHRADSCTGPGREHALSLATGQRRPFVLGPQPTITQFPLHLSAEQTCRSALPEPPELTEPAPPSERSGVGEDQELLRWSPGSLSPSAVCPGSRRDLRPSK